MATNYASIKKYLVLLLLLIAGISSAFSQSSHLNGVLNKFAIHEMPEHIYIQYDKSRYQPGETIWFKAYLMAGAIPAGNTRNFYIDWIDDNGRVILHDCYPVANASTHGQFDIPEHYTGKTLHIQAYTKWMLNFDTAFLYRKTLYIAQQNSVDRQSFTNPGNTLLFFPEGGDIVAGLFNRIAFMAVNRYQQPVQLSGYISTTTGQVLDSFQSQHDGMGYFYLQPSPGMLYRAHWKDAEGQQHSTDLPPAKTTGVAFNLHITPGKHILQLQRTDDTATCYQQLHLVATQYQQLVYEADLPLDHETSTQIAIPVSALQSGILRYTVFDANWRPVAERISFINNGGYTISPILKADTISLEKRGLNILTLSVPDSLQADLSIAITDDMEIPTDSSDNILSGLLLSSEIKGKIHHPSYYFKDNSLQTQEALDLVMLTHGWRRYNWEKILQGTSTIGKYQRDTAYLCFSGQLSTNRPGTLQKVLQDTSRKHVLLFSVRPKHDTLTQFFTLPLHSDGHFSMPNLLVFDTLQVGYQFSDKQINFSKFDIDFIPAKIDSAIPVYQPATLHAAGEISQNKTYQTATWQDRGKGIRLKTVQVKAKAKSPTEQLEEKYTSKSSLFRNIYGYGVDIEDDKQAILAMNIFTYLMMKIPGLIIEPNPNPVNRPLLRWTGYRSNVPGKGIVPPSLYYNEAITNADFLMSLSMSEIAYVKAFTPPFGVDEGGAIAIYTKSRKNYYNATPSSLKQETIIGYTAIRECYTPDYSSADIDSLPDTRTTLYWQPMLRTTSADSLIKIRFYNNDYTKSYRVIIEGVTKNGQLARIERRIN